MKVRFGGFTLDLETRQLLRGGEELRLSRKAFDLLAILIARRPGVVEKDTLRERLWAGTSVVDANLNNLISEIRSALEDDPQEPKFVRTVHRVGYAFCGTASGDRGTPAGTDRAPRVWLVWNDRTIVLNETMTVIGRDPESAIWIDVPGVSRRHASIYLTTDGATTTAMLEDLGSTNGTFVDGRRLTTRIALEDGNAIRIGEATLTFRTWSSTDAPTKRIRRNR